MKFEARRELHQAKFLKPDLPAAFLPPFDPQARMQKLLSTPLKTFITYIEMLFNEAWLSGPLEIDVWIHCSGLLPS